jgi:rare lipoprotein A
MNKLKTMMVSFALIISIESNSQVDSSETCDSTHNLVDDAIKEIKKIGSGIKHVVSYYADKFNGRLTASGKIFYNYGYTCAAISLYSLGDILLVTNIANGKSVKVVVTDRGNFQRLGRTLDLSKRAFSDIADPKKGLCHVTIEKLNTKHK